MELSQKEARALMIEATGLARRGRRRARKSDVLHAIRQMGVLQIDTISAVARSPYLVLWSRLGNYDPRWLDELLAEGEIFEYWSHEASFVPIEDFPIYRHRMLNPVSMGWKFSAEWVEQNRGHVDKVLDHIRTHGAMRSSDFSTTRGSGGWWGWKPEKRALEMLLTAGELMIARRHNFQRIYDLRERVMPTWNDARALSKKDALRMQVVKAVRALGVTKERWISDYFRTDKRQTPVIARELADEGALKRVKVQGWNDSGYVHHETSELIESASRTVRPALTTLLSPFDPLVWDRARTSEMFGFDYRLECYTPAPKRRFGYFTLPILYKDRLIGRLDPKAHRKEGRFEVRSLHLEPGVIASDSLIASVARAIKEFAEWNQTPEVTIVRTEPAKVGALLRKALRDL